MSISDISEVEDNLGYFEIKFKSRKKKTIKNYKNLYGEEYDYRIKKFDIKVLEKIRNEFFKYTNIINAQETDKEQPKHLVDDTVRTAQIT